jgi:hypothetical protein
MRKSTAPLATTFLLLLSSAPAFGDANAKITKCAQADVGKKMWSGYGLSNGTLGCALHRYGTRTRACMGSRHGCAAGGGTLRLLLRALSAMSIFNP